MLYVLSELFVLDFFYVTDGVVFAVYYLFESGSFFKLLPGGFSSFMEPRIVAYKPW